MPTRLLQAEVQKIITCSGHSLARPYAAAVSLSLSFIDRSSLLSIRSGAARPSSKLGPSRFIASERYSCHNPAYEKADSLRRIG